MLSTVAEQVLLTSEVTVTFPNLIENTNGYVRILSSLVHLFAFSSLSWWVVKSLGRGDHEYGCIIFYRLVILCFLPSLASVFSMNNQLTAAQPTGTHRS
jgi:hypothetical protein